MILDQEKIYIFTDGACSGNPGPMGIGYVYVYIDEVGKEVTKEVSEGIGHGTNNIAELTAIKRAIAGVKRKDVPTIVCTDSAYSIGVLSGNFKAKKNVDLISEIKSIMVLFNDLKFLHVAGHAGMKYNEIADKLATAAIEKGH